MVCDFLSRKVKQEAGKLFLCKHGQLFFFLPSLCFRFTTWYTITVLFTLACAGDINSCFKNGMKGSCYMKSNTTSYLCWLFLYHKAIQLDFEVYLSEYKYKTKKIKLFFPFLSLTFWLSIWASHTASLFLFSLVCLTDWHKVLWSQIWPIYHVWVPAGWNMS